MSESSKENKSSIFEKLAPVILIIMIGLAFLVGVLWQKVENLSKGGTAKQAAVDTTPSKLDLNQIKDLFNKDVIKFGNADSKLIIVEASDPSCPYCHVAGGLNSKLNAEIDPQFKLVKDGGTYVAPVPEIKKLVESGKASFVWLYYPGHGRGEMGTKAMYCAFEKGKFWEVHDLLMTSAGYNLLNEVVLNDKANAGKLADYLKSAFNPTEMKACLESDKYNDRLNAEMSIVKTQIMDTNPNSQTGTPTFTVNDTRFGGAYSYKDMESAVASALK